MFYSFKSFFLNKFAYSVSVKSFSTDCLISSSLLGLKYDTASAPTSGKHVAFEIHAGQPLVNDSKIGIPNPSYFEGK